MARDILLRLEYPEPFIEEVCDIIGHHHHPREQETPNFKVVYDADLLTNTEEARSAQSGEAAQQAADGFLTAAGARIDRASAVQE